MASWTNYNSVMIGDRAGGMGGAFTANTEDTAAGAYYNPATLARLKGSSLSTSVSLFNKYDVAYGNQSDLDEAVFRINKGTLLSIPAASGIFSSFRSFAAGLSIVMPDYQTFGGNIYKNGDDTTFLRYDNQSLWIGGAIAFNLSEEEAFGLTAYYTSQSESRSVTNRYDAGGGDTVVRNEEKTLSQNALVYILGYYKEVSAHWRLGTSYRFRSIQIEGSGSYLESQVGTVSGAQPLIQKNIKAETRIPDRLAIGVSYVRAEDWTASFDIVLTGSSRYDDFEEYADQIVREEVVNYALGIEKHLDPWLALRLGLFTDYSSAPKIPNTPDRRYQDQVDKLGFSANLGIHTTEHTMVSLGGYYVGGDGWAAERIGPGYQRIAKTDRTFSFLVGASSRF